MKRIFIGLLVLLLGAVVVAMIAAGIQTREAEEAKRLAEIEKAKQKDNITGKSVTFTVTEGAQKKWTIDAKEAVYFTDNSGATLKDVKGTFFNKEGKPVLTFTSPAGEYRTKDHKVHLTGGVVAASTKEEKQTADTPDNSFHLKAPTMNWSSRSDIVVAEGGIVMKHGASGESQAQRCRFKLDMSDISLDGNVRSAMSL